MQLGLNKQLQPHEIKSYKHKIRNQKHKIKNHKNDQTGCENFYRVGHECRRAIYLL